VFPNRTKNSLVDLNTLIGKNTQIMFCSCASSEQSSTERPSVPKKFKYWMLYYRSSSMQPSVSNLATCRW